MVGENTVLIVFCHIMEDDTLVMALTLHIERLLYATDQTYH